MDTISPVAGVGDARARNWLYRLPVKRPGREQFVGLDVLRAVASAMIIIFHAHSMAAARALDVGVPFVGVPAFWYSCIELFFTMSGFLMVHMSRSLYGRPDGWRTFLLRRASRTPPLYYLYTIGIFCVMLVLPPLADGPVTWERLAASIAFVPNPVPPVIAIGWTLNYEVYFYLIVGVSLFLRFPYGPIASLLFLVAAVTVGMVVRPTVDPFMLWTDPLLLDFAIGIAVALLYYVDVAIGRYLRAVLIVVALILLLLPDQVPERYSLIRPATFGIGMGIFVAIMTLRSAPPRFGVIERPVVAFGARAYTFYLSHIFVLKLVSVIVFALVPPAVSPYVFIVVGLATAVAVGWVLYGLVELPITRALQAWAKRKSAVGIRP